MLIICTLILLLYLFYEYFSYKSYITPFFIIGLVHALSLPIINVIAPKLGYYRISDTTILLFTIYLSIIFWSDFVFKLIAQKKGSSIIYSEDSIFIKQQKIIWYAFIICLAGYVLSFFQAVQIYGISNIKGKSSGIWGHMGLVCISLSPLVIVLFLTLKKAKYLLSLLGLYFIMLLFGGKTYIFISIVASTLLIYIDRKIEMKAVIKIGSLLALVVFLVFTIIYTIIPCLNMGITDWPTIKKYFIESMQHLFYYYAAPFLGSNAYFVMPIAEGIENGMKIMFAPIVSIYEVLLGDKQYPSIIMKNWVQISESAHRTTSNVGGLFSESVFHIGYIGASIYVFIISIYVNTLYYIKKNTKYYHASAALGIALLGLCFFVNYFTLLVVLELIVYLFLFESVLMILEKKKRYIKDWRFKKGWKKVRL